MNDIITINDLSSLVTKINLCCDKLQMKRLDDIFVSSVHNNNITAQTFNMIINLLRVISSNPRCGTRVIIPQEVMPNQLIERLWYDNLLDAINSAYENIDRNKVDTKHDIKNNLTKSGGGSVNFFYEQQLSLDGLKHCNVGICANFKSTSSEDLQGTSKCREAFVWGNLRSQNSTGEVNGSDAGTNPGPQSTPGMQPIIRNNIVSSGDVFKSFEVSTVPDNNIYKLLDQRVFNSGNAHEWRYYLLDRNDRREAKRFAESLGNWVFRLYVKRSGNLITFKYSFDIDCNLGDWRRRGRYSWNAVSSVSLFN